jgi:succinyl-CoA synthetase beta subunit
LKIHEYQAKEILSARGLPVEVGVVISELAQLDEALQKISSGPWVIKAQIHAGGRGKAGGVKLAKTTRETREWAKQILGMNLVSPQTGPQGKKVRKILIAPAVEYTRELYVSVVLDRKNQCPVFLYSTEGGVEIEELAATKPQAIQRVLIDPAQGMLPFQAREIYFNLNLPKENIAQGTKVFQRLVQTFLDLDLSLIEINPMVILKSGELFCLDAKIMFEDNGLLRHAEYLNMRDLDEEDPREMEAAKSGLSYISLNGDIGCLVNGAGLAMATADAIQYFGGTPANFLDVGGGASTASVTHAFKIILSDSRVKAILVNIFGGIMKCDVIAQGIIDAAKQVKLNVPLVIRLEGTNVDKGKELLKSSSLNYKFADSLNTAAKEVVLAVQGANV